jgi:ketosteroid isomerase-like protein
MTADRIASQMERVCRAWDAAIADGDISSLVNLHAPDAEIESPLIYEFTGSKPSVLRGRDAFHSLSMNKSPEAK